MKQHTIKTTIAMLALALVLINGCKKEDTPSKTVKVSHPTINLVGDPVVILHVGDTYTDAGATYTDSMYGDHGTLTTTTEINTAEEGFFIVTYSATNQYGFEGSGTRLVAVTNADDALDVSGDYARASNGAPVTVTKVGRGVFQTDNVSGAASGTTDAAYFMFKADSSMVMPVQFLPNFIATAAFVDPVYDFTASPPNYSYVIDNPGFAPSLRVFEKQ
jgi:hypothetical protein